MRCYLALALLALFVISASAEIEQDEESRAELGSGAGFEGSRRGLKCIGSSCGGFYYNRRSRQFFSCGLSQFGSFFPCGVNNGFQQNGFTFSPFRQSFFSGFNNIGNFRSRGSFGSSNNFNRFGSSSNRFGSSFNRFGSSFNRIGSGFSGSSGFKGK